jgi:hypothetical protein
MLIIESRQGFPGYRILLFDECYRLEAVEREVAIVDCHVAVELS